MKLPVLLLLFLTGLLCHETVAQKPQPLSRETKSDVINNLSKALLDNYIFYDTAVAMNKLINSRWKQGAYDELTSPPDFAKRLTDDLRSVYNDAHLTISFNPAQEKMMLEPRREGPSPNGNENARKDNFGFRKVEMMPNNIGYFSFDRFYVPDADAKEIIKAVFTYLKNCDALIIDVRNNGGGQPEMVKYLCSYLFKEATHINSLYQRRNKSLQRYVTEPIAASVHFSEVPVYVLVNRRTFSAAEEFAYDLQSLGRARIIGEVTGGGAHPVGPQSIGSGFIGLIPFAKAINPITKTNWEAVGVKPDVVSSNENCIETALLNYLDHQIATVADAAKMKKLKWTREMLYAKLNPYVADLATLSSYS